MNTPARTFVLTALFSATAFAAAPANSSDSPPLLLREPTIHRDAIVFVFAGDLWRVPRTGGDAIRLTSHHGEEGMPRFSPDGTQIAFTGHYDGNTDVYVMPAAGGTPTRVTAHPGADIALGWTPDGSRILFRSPRHNTNPGNRLFTVAATGGLPTEVPLPIAEEGSYSADGRRLAYVPNFQWQAAWKRYRGGQTQRIWLATLADSSVEMLPRENSNDFNPLWSGDTIYFLSDREGPVTLFAYDMRSRAVRRVIENTGLDFKSASLGTDAIVLEQFGALHVLDLKTQRTARVNVRVSGDFPEVRRRLLEVKGAAVNNARLSATGQRAVFEARGDIISVPAEKGDVRNLTRTPSGAERDPAWSPDGKWIAWFSDVSGEYELHLSDQTGLGEKRVIKLSEPSFFYAPAWSPDSKHLVYSDKHLRLWLLTVEGGHEPVKIDEAPLSGLDSGYAGYAWSPDSKWVTFARLLPNRLGAVFIYGLEDKKVHQVTDGMSDAISPDFDAGGKYLYFAASTDIGPASQSWGDLSSLNRPATRNLYLAVLDKTVPSPLAPESDEENGGDDKKERAKDDSAKPDEDRQTAIADSDPKAKSGPAKADEGGSEEKKDDDASKEKPVVVKIDFEDITQRIVALPMPAKNYKGLVAGKAGTLWVLEGPTIDPTDGPVDVTLHKFDLEKREPKEIGDGLRAFDVSDDGGKILYRKGDDWFIVGADEAPKADAKPLRFGGLTLEVEPRAEWRQMFHEAWRIQRDFFYDPNLHGLDLKVMTARYEPFLDGIASRADLNRLFEEMLGEMTAGHTFIGGGDEPEFPRISAGLLGADYTLEGGRYRFARIYSGESWNPNLRAPLTEPGVNVAAGEYLLAVDGRELTADDEVFSFFLGRADRLVTLRVGPKPDGSGARDVQVRPVDDESGLRNRAWIEDNRRRVSELSDGQLAYVYVPDTYAEGYTSFNRYYFAQVDKAGFIIDERYNQGGFLADYIIDHLRRPILSYAHERDGMDISSPLGASAGPKVMLINEYAGSGGDYLPWTFRKAGIGTLVGKRTWGGLIGIGGYPPLLDGGGVTAPRWAIYGTDGEWEVENVGIAPDIEVELEPRAWREGRDTQLEKAVEIALEQLRRNPPRPAKRPAYPNYHRR